MIGSLIGAGLNVAGSIYGGIKAKQAMQERLNSINKEMERNQANFDKDYYQDPTNDTSFVAAMEAASKLNRQSMRQLAATGAVAGGISPEAMAVAQQQQANQQAQTLTDAGLRMQQRKDAAKQQYEQRRQSLQEQIDNAKLQQAQATAQAVQGVTKAAGSIASAF